MQTILIVDDDRDICLLLKRFLTRHGYEVLEAYSGKKALELLDETQPDLVMCDFRLEVPAVVSCRKTAFESALVHVEYEAALDMSLVISPFGMNAEPVLLESLNVRRIGKFVVVIVRAEPFKRSRNVQVKRRAETVSGFGQNVLAAEAIVVKRRVRIVVERGGKALRIDVATCYQIRPARVCTPQGYILLIGVVGADTGM